MKDITSTTFGLTIAFILPGLAGFYSLAYWFPLANEIFASFSAMQSNLALFFIVLLFSLIIGLLITLLRWLIFEKCICGKYILEKNLFQNIGVSQEKLAAFRAVVDEHYRYHQFWGGTCIVMPVFLFGWGVEGLSGFTGFICDYKWLLAILIFLALETLTIFGARQAYIHYIERGNMIMK